MIVVSIIALLAVIAVPSFLRARQRSQNSKFINALRIAMDSIDTYAAENAGRYPPDTGRGVVPPTLASYLDPTLNWSGRTPIGGQWDWDFDVFNSRAAISVVTPNADVEQLREIDRQFDDGDLSTGRFQSKGGDRYSGIVEQ